MTLIYLKWSNITEMFLYVLNKNYFRVIADAIRTPSRRFFQFTIHECIAYTRFFWSDTHARVQFNVNISETKQKHTRITSVVRIWHMLRISFGVHDGIHVQRVYIPQFPVCEQQVLRLLVNSSPLSIVGNYCQRAKSRMQILSIILDCGQNRSKPLSCHFATFNVDSQ